MATDPIVEEVHELRRQLLAECGGDFQKYLNRVQELAAKEPHTYAAAADTESAAPTSQPAPQLDPKRRSA